MIKPPTKNAVNKNRNGNNNHLHDLAIILSRATRADNNSNARVGNRAIAISKVVNRETAINRVVSNPTGTNRVVSNSKVNKDNREASSSKVANRDSRISKGSRAVNSNKVADSSNRASKVNRAAKTNRASKVVNKADSREVSKVASNPVRDRAALPMRFAIWRMVCVKTLRAEVRPAT